MTDAGRPLFAAFRSGERKDIVFRGIWLSIVRTHVSKAMPHARLNWIPVMPAPMPCAMPRGVSFSAARESLRTISAPIVTPIASQNSLRTEQPFRSARCLRRADLTASASRRVCTVLRTP